MVIAVPSNPAGLKGVNPNKAATVISNMTNGPTYFIGSNSGIKIIITMVTSDRIFNKPALALVATSFILKPLSPGISCPIAKVGEVKKVWYFLVSIIFITHIIKNQKYILETSNIQYISI